MLFMFESTMAKSRLKTLTELRRVRVDNQTIMVHRCGKYVILMPIVLLFIYLFIYLYKLFSRYLLNVVNSRWVKLSGTELLPGDVVSIGRSSGQNGEDKNVPADMLILAGSAIVNEAILTGESTPQWKVILSYLLYFFVPCKFVVMCYLMDLICGNCCYCVCLLLFFIKLFSVPIYFCLHYHCTRTVTCWMFKTIFIK